MAKTQGRTQEKAQASTPRARRKSGAQVVGEDFLELIDRVSAEVQNKGLSRVLLEIDGVSLEIANKPEYVVANAASAPQPGVVTRIAAGGGAPPAASVTGAEALPDVDLEDVVSPVTGTLYAAPGPGEPPFVKVSDRVKKGDVLCIVEAMKTMNKIASRYDGTVHSIEVTNGEVVQAGQVLVRIKP